MIHRTQTTKRNMESTRTPPTMPQQTPYRTKWGNILEENPHPDNITRENQTKTIVHIANQSPKLRKEKKKRKQRQGKTKKEYTKPLNK